MSGGSRTAGAQDQPALETLVQRAQNGDRDSLEQIVQRIQDKLYGLALRMLWNPEDAQDATQEILIRIVTHLGSFRGESAFLTWAYRVAANHLSTVRKSRLEEQRYTFQVFGEELEKGLAEPRSEPSIDHDFLLQEIRIGCTLGMLLCLDRPHRMAFILGEILELNHQEAASVLEVDPATFRKRLSRARNDLIAFSRTRCGLTNPENPCRCRRRVEYALNRGRLNPARLLFSGDDSSSAEEFPRVLAEIRKLEESQRLIALYRCQPEVASANGFAAIVRGLVDRL